MSSINTDLSKSPFYNDYNQEKDYYQVLFQPGVSVQTRELNELQSILQKQIERFGDNIYKSGTILSGCNFVFYNPYPYIKIKDLDENYESIITKKFVGYNLLNEQTGLRAWVTNYQDGYESTSPSLKTLYITYQNRGSNGTTTSYAAGDVLKVYDPIYNGIENVKIINGGVGFSNSDTVVVTPAAMVTVDTGTLNIGDYITTSKGTNVEIVAITSDTTTNATIVTYAPRSVDLANISANSISWTFQIGDSFSNPESTISGKINNLIGTNFKGRVLTDSVGTVQSIVIINKGSNYTTNPYITIRSINNTTGYASLTLAPKNYLTRITISAGLNAVGNGYAFGVTEGVIYQKGLFLRVFPQVTIVSKYMQTPDNVAVGFVTDEQIVDSSVDTDLVDNASGRKNVQAPGAARLKLIPKLKVVDITESDANAQFFTICEWKEGKAYKQNQVTTYNTIGDELAKRTEEAQGDFVTDPFLITTRGPLDANNDALYYNVVIDPGTAYISGYRVSTSANYNIDAYKGVNTSINNTHAIALNYGNYILVNNLGGIFQFNTADYVDLYDTAKNLYSTPETSLSPLGTKIGTANIRSLVLQDGFQGSSAAVYRLYLFNIQMNSGKSFKDVRSIYYNGTNKGICDVITKIDATTSNAVADILYANNDHMLFDSGVESLKNANNIVYTYRTIDQNLHFEQNATISKDISASVNESFTFGSNTTLSAAQLQQLIVTPIDQNMVEVLSRPGNAAITNSSDIISGTGTNFIEDFVSGDYLTISANSSGGGIIRQVSYVVNNTYMILTSNTNFSNTAAKLYRTFPKNIPMPFGYREGLYGSVNSNGTIIILGCNYANGYGMTFNTSGSIPASMAIDIQRTNVTQQTKTANRDRFIKINTDTNADGITGPWCLGVPDAFRLKGVYIGESDVNDSGTNYASNFYIDHNQTKNYYGLSWLYIRPDSNIVIDTGSYILVKFDYFTTSGPGFYDTVSYLGTANLDQIMYNDSLSLENLGSGVNTWEIPEVFASDGTEYDLIRYFDFRPYVANTVAPSFNVESAPVDPSSTEALNTTGEKKIPSPDTLFYSTIEYYTGHTDSLFVDKSGRFTLLSGTSSANSYLRTPPQQPTFTLKISDISVPAYPALPINPNNDMVNILNNGLANQNYLKTRQTTRVITAPKTKTIPYLQPKVYTMSDIGKIDRRLTDVEYYVALNALESGLSQKVIPSSKEPSLNRFKFGIFVDDFTTASWSNLNDPQYAALKEEADIVPPKMNWDVTNVAYDVPWMDYPIIKQDIATLGGIDDPESTGPKCAANLGNTVAYQQYYRNFSDMEDTTQPDVVSLNFAANTTVYETINYVQGNIQEWLTTHQYNSWTVLDDNINRNVIAGYINTYYNGTGEPNGITITLSDGTSFIIPNSALNLPPRPTPQERRRRGEDGGTRPSNEELIATIYAQIASYMLQNPTVVSNVPTGGTYAKTTYFPPVVLYFYNYDYPAKLEIYQENNLIIDTSSAKVLTASEKEFLKSSTANHWFNDYPEYFMKDVIIGAGGYVTYAGKLEFNYNPTLGTKFLIKTTNGAGTYRWRWVLAYPIDGASAGCVAANTVRTIRSDGFNANYEDVDLTLWCGNGVEMGTAKMNILTGFTEIWTPVPIPTPSTSVVPFDISQNWYS